MTAKKSTDELKGKLKDERKLEFAILLAKLKKFKNYEIADFFGIRRQTLTYHLGKEENKNESSS